MQEVMRAAVLHKPGEITIESVPRPEVGPNEALVRVVGCGVCGSDIPRMLTKGAHKLPLICGHEFSGRIAALGSGMDEWKEGELVAIPPLIPCFKCAQCLIGEPSRCEDYDYFGSRRDGAYAEYVNVPASNLLRVPEGIDPTAVALADPAAIALHAIGKTNLTLGQRVAVVGCGPIGLVCHPMGPTDGRQRNLWRSTSAIARLPWPKRPERLRERLTLHRLAVTGVLMW